MSEQLMNKLRTAIPQLKDLEKNLNIIVIGKTWCGFTKRALDLIANEPMFKKSCHFVVVDANDLLRDAWKRILDLPSNQTVPIVLIKNSNGKWVNIGGCDDFEKWLQTKKHIKP